MADEAPTFEQQTENFVVDSTAEPQPAAETTKEAPNGAETTTQGQSAEAAGEGQSDTANEEGTGSEADTGGNSESDAVGSDTTTELSDSGKPKKLTAAQRHAEIQARTNELTRQLRETERQVAEALARLDGTKKGGLTEQTRDTTNVDSDAPPDPAAFEYGELDGKFIEAKIAHGVKQALKATKAEEEKTRQADAAAAKQREMQQKATALEEAGSKKYDDFSEVVVEGARRGAYPITPTLGELILSSPEGADVAYHLASNLKEAREITGKSPMEQAAWFGRIAARFSPTPSGAATQKVVKTTQAPPPVKTARGAGANPGFDPATADFSEFERQVNGRK